VKKVYFIVPSEEFLPTNKQIQSIKIHADVETIIHAGKLADLKQLQSDKSQKILALDPDTFEWDLDTATLKDIPNVFAICHSSTSFDWVKPAVLKEFGVGVSNVPGFSSDSVAEYVVCMAIEVARQMPMVIKNDWKPVKTTGSFLLKGKKAGVIGLGRIGVRIAEVLRGIGMEVLYWSKSSVDERFTKVELDDLFKQADVIIPALAENTETEKLLTHDRLDLIRPTSICIGINRVKALWDEEYLISKVEKGEIGGYACEGDTNKNVNSYKGNVWILPPIAWQTRDSLESLTQIWVDNIIGFATGKPQNLVN